MAPSAGERPVCLLEGFLVVQTLRDPEFLHPRLQVSAPSWLAVPASLFSLAVWALTLFYLASGYIDLPVITLSLHALLCTTAPLEIYTSEAAPIQRPKTGFSWLFKYGKQKEQMKGRKGVYVSCHND